MIPHLADTPVIATERLTLRAPGPQDWEAYAAFMASDRSLALRPADFDRAKAWRSFGHMIGMWVLRGFGQFVVTRRETGAAIGSIGPWYPEGWAERELGWSIWVPEAEGRGLAYEAASAARDHAFRDLGWDTAVSYVAPDNARSIALAERLGARLDRQAVHGFDKPALVYRHPRPEAA